MRINRYADVCYKEVDRQKIIEAIKKVSEVESTYKSKGNNFDEYA